MTRQECEAKITEKLREIWDIAKEYAPGQKKHLNMHVDEECASCFRIVGETDYGNNIYDINIFDRREGKA